MPDLLELSRLWLRQYHPAPGAGLTLVAFPHAGGSASYFQPLSAALSPDVEVLSLQYPGRQDRRSEPCLDSIGGLVEGICEVLSPRTERPVVFFGHSMGAVLAYETARRLEKESSVRLLGLVASGRRSPTTAREETVHLRDDAGILAEIQRLNGTDSALLQDEDIQRMILPSLRADYTAVETYAHQAGPALRCPVTVFTGDADPQVTRAEAERWSELTDGGFRLRSFPGGHFYLATRPGAVTGALTEEIAAFRTPGSRAAAAGPGDVGPGAG
ncbi:thioesterase II family protein [Streptomyces sp. BE303]|uniref:thioesterase II family protein n=1 Tax=Streptomyces sp. BE303 TaxID=3002528 RepID=UPI002E764F82|nr:alpha/beta fold hydrolase [Streptomyces sp. BE303]MED7953059.1 alpha/beta fold hydrolase [Streptomyces sp. BE303]